MKTLIMPIIGLPNVGKSSLLNALIGKKVSIVTSKPHTTRTLLYSSKTIEDSEVLLVDTPGIDKVSNKLGTVIFNSMQEYLKSLDEMILVLDATNPYLEKFAAYIEKSIVVLNKIDYLKKFKLLPILEQLKQLNAKEVFCVCAKTGEGIKELSEYLKKRSLFAEIESEKGSLVEENIVLYACECVREKILLKFDQEVPYKIIVEPTSFSLPSNSAWDIRLNIIVPKQSYKPIIIGKKAENLKEIGKAARLEISAKLNQSGFLGLNVVVDEKLWKKDQTYLNLGWKV